MIPSENKSVGSTVRVPSVRDTQKSKVYSAAKLAHYLYHGEYLPSTLSEEETVELVEGALTHLGVTSRWGKRHVELQFPSRGNWASSDSTKNIIILPRGARDSLTVLHEVAHLLPTLKREADHGPGFVSIYRYLVAIMLGIEVAELLDAAFASLDVRFNDLLIPPVRSGQRYSPEDIIPGIFPGDAGEAAETIRLAAAAGMFGEVGDPHRAVAYSIARKLSRMEPRSLTRSRRSSSRLPRTVTIPVEDLIAAADRNAVAEVTLDAIRRTLHETPIIERRRERRNPRKPQ